MSKPFQSLLELTIQCNSGFFNAFKNPKYLPLFCDQQQIGLVSPELQAIVLDRIQDVFLLKKSNNEQDRLVINPELDTSVKRTLAVEKLLRQMRQDTNLFALKAWRDEHYDVRLNYDQPTLFQMERAATCLFGIKQYGVDINGFVHHPENGLCVWMQRRSKTKQTWPGKLDNFVGGGLSTGLSVLETAHKEAMEEANVSEDIAKNMQPAGSVSFFFESERGLFPNTEFVFDLELPLDFVPGNNDGEVEDFELFPVNKVKEILLSPDMKTTSCPVLLDFLIRKGVISIDKEPLLLQLMQNLHFPIHDLYNNKKNNFLSVK